jgi:hypothetical protein
VEWTRDGKYVSCISHRFDDYGNAFSGIALLDVKTGERITVFANDPKSDKVVQSLEEKNNSLPTNSHIAFVGRRCTMIGRETGKPTYSDGEEDILYSYDIKTRKLSEIDHGVHKIGATALYYAGYFFKPCWSPDDRKLLFEKERITGLPNDDDLEYLYVYKP